MWPLFEAGFRGERSCLRSTLPSSQTNMGSRGSELARCLGTKVIGLEGRIRGAAGQEASWRPAPERLCALGEGVRGCGGMTELGHGARVTLLRDSLA